MKVVQIKDKKTGMIVAPQTHMKAVVDDNGNDVESKFAMYGKDVNKMAMFRGEGLPMVSNKDIRSEGELTPIMASNFLLDVKLKGTSAGNTFGMELKYNKYGMVKYANSISIRWLKDGQRILVASIMISKTAPKGEQHYDLTINEEIQDNPLTAAEVLVNYDAMDIRDIQGNYNQYDFESYVFDNDYLFDSTTGLMSERRRAAETEGKISALDMSMQNIEGRTIIEDTVVWEKTDNSLLSDYSQTGIGEYTNIASSDIAFSSVVINDVSSYEGNLPVHCDVYIVNEKAARKERECPSGYITKETHTLIGSAEFQFPEQKTNFKIELGKVFKCPKGSQVVAYMTSSSKIRVSSTAAGSTGNAEGTSNLMLFSTDGKKWSAGDIRGKYKGGFGPALSLESKPIFATRDYIDEDVLTRIKICMPSTIDAVVGDTLQLYYKSIFRCVNPYIYDISINCKAGKQFPRYYELRATNAGTYDINIAIKSDSNKVIAEKTSRINIAGKPLAPAQNINVLCIGASSMQNGEWVGELKRRLTGTGTPATEIQAVFPEGVGLKNITFIGKKEVSYNGTTVNLEAMGGYNFSNYISTDASDKMQKFFFTSASRYAGGAREGDIYSYNGHNYTIVEININEVTGVGNISCKTDASGYIQSRETVTLVLVQGSGASSLSAASANYSGNPFLYDNGIDVARYVQECGADKIDVIFAALCTNNMPKYADIEDLDYMFNGVTGTMTTFIKQFRDVYPDVKFCICTPTCPDEKGGMGENYGAVGGGYAKKYSYMTCVSAIQKYIKENNLSDSVYICDIMNEFDSENDFMQTKKKVNTRSLAEEVFGVNGVHPSPIGYMQMADAAYRLFVAKFCQ